MKPIDYRVRTSRRAKHLQLKISHRDGLVVVVPMGFDRQKIGELIEEKRPWIEKHLQRIEGDRKRLSIEDEKPLPDRIVLRAIAEEWFVEYRFIPARWGRLEEQRDSRLLIYGDVENHALCTQLLDRWLRHKANVHLPTWIRKVSRELGLPFCRVAIRNQRTKWASCSSKKNISLNQKLLFLPPQLARHVLIHELCHTVHPSHSSAFWSFLGEKDAECRELKSALRNAWRYVPGWAERRMS